jgi:hypothetical protein
VSLSHHNMLHFGAQTTDKARRIDEIAMADFSPEKAGVGGSTPSRGTTPMC